MLAWEMAGLNARLNPTEIGAVHFLYHLTIPEYRHNIFEGYIGVSKTPHKRFLKHIELARKEEPKTHVHRRLKPHIETAHIVVLAAGAQDSILFLERLIRGWRNIGWNTRIGG